MTTADFDHPYSDAVHAGDTVFVSGCLPLDEQENLAPEGRPSIDAALATVERRLVKAGLDLGDVVKLTYFVTDIGYRTLANDQYVATWSEPRPARTVVQVVGLPRGATVEIDAIAHRRSGAASS